MECLKCGFASEAQTAECFRCGVIFARYRGPDLATSDNATTGATTSAETMALERQEWIQRLLALPAALVIAWVSVRIAPAAVRLLSMWIHETGHAMTAWFCGYWAVPGPWFTPVGAQRSVMLSVFLVGVTGFGGFLAWQRQRWLWVGIAATLGALLIGGPLLLYSDQAQQLIIFGGDAGCFVLGAVLMSTFYAPHDSPIYQNGLRWGFLGIGALSFMDAFAVWTGGLQSIPLGENENGLSDSSVLTDLYGWSFKILMDRYYRLAMLCFIALGLLYVLGLVSANRGFRR